MNVIEKVKNGIVKVVKKVRKIKQQVSKPRRDLSERHRYSVDFPEIDFGILKQEELCNICDIPVNFNFFNSPPPIPKKWEDRRDWRRHFLSIPSSLNLLRIIELTEMVATKVLDADFKVSTDVLEFARKNTGRRNNKSYYVRYVEKVGQNNYLTDPSVGEIIRNGQLQTLNLLEALFQFILYSLCFNRKIMDRLGNGVVCPETNIKDASGQIVAVAVLKLVSISFNGPGEVPKVTSLRDYKGKKMESRSKPGIYIEFVPIEKLEWNQWPRRVLA